MEFDELCLLCSFNVMSIIGKTFVHGGIIEEGFGSVLTRLLFSSKGFRICVIGCSFLKLWIDAGWDGLNRLKIGFLGLADTLAAYVNSSCSRRNASGSSRASQ